MFRNYDVKQNSFRLSFLLFWQKIIRQKPERKNHINKEKSGEGREEAVTRTERMKKNHSDALAPLFFSFLFRFHRLHETNTNCCNIRFLNPIVGTPEKPSCTYSFFSIFFFLASAFFRWFCWNIKKPQWKGKKSSSRNIYFFY